MATHFSPSERQNYFKSVNFYPSASCPLVYFSISPFHLHFYQLILVGCFISSIFFKADPSLGSSAIYFLNSETFSCLSASSSKEKNNKRL